MEYLTPKPCRWFLFLAGLILSLLSPSARATVLYFDPNGSSAVTANTYTWNTTTAQWSTSTTLTASTVVWNSADAACFCAGNFSGAITVVISSVITNEGIFNGPLTPPGCNLTINGSGAGTLYLVGTNGPSSGGRDSMDLDGSDLLPTTLNVPISGPGIMVLEGDAQLYLNGTNTYSGGTYVGYLANAWESVVNVTNSYAFGTGPITITNTAGGAIVLSGTNAVTITNSIVVANSGNFMNWVGNPAGLTFSGPLNLGAFSLGLGSGGVAGANDLVVLAGPISGSGSLIKYGYGILELAGTNTFTGSIQVTNGTLALAANGFINNLSSLALLPTNGNPVIFDVSATNAYLMPSATTLIAAGGAYSASINGASGGTVSLGTSPISLLFANNGAPLIISQGALLLNNNNITVSNMTGFPLGSGTYPLIQVTSGLITNAPNQYVVVTGPGIASGCVAYTEVSGGSVYMVVAQSVNTPVWNGADYANSPNWSDAMNWVNGASPVTGDQVTFEGTTGLAPVMDYTNFLYSLTFDSTAGAFTLDNSNGSFLSVSAGVTNASANMQTIDLPVGLDNSQVQWALTGGPMTVNGPISDDANGLAISGPNTLTFTATNTYTGPTAIGAGSTLAINGTGALGNGSYPGALSIPSTATLNYNSSAAQTLSGAISGAGQISVGGTGPLTLSGVSSYTGGILLASGSALTIGGAGDLGGGTYAGNLVLPASATFTYDSTAAQTLSGVVSGLGALVVDAGTLTLSGKNTYTANTTINGGTLKIGGSGDLGDLGGSSGGSYSSAILDNGTLSYASTASQILSGVISGSGKLAVSAGTLTLTNASGNTYSGGTTLSGGTLNVNAISDSGVSDIGAGGVTIGGGTLNYNGSAPVTTSRQFTGTTGTTTPINTAAALTLNGRVTGSGTFDVTFNGPGTLTLGNSADNSFLGMNINGGTVILNTTSASGVHGLGTASTINSGGTLQLSGSGGYDIYSGVVVTNNGGVLDLNGQSLSAAGIAGLTLSGTGTGAGALINSAATTTSVLSLNNNSIVIAGNTTIGGPGNITLINRAMSGGFTLTYAGTGTLTLANGNNTNTGAITISSGTLALGQNGATHGSLYSSSASVTAAPGATLACTATNGVCSIAGLTTLNSGASALFTAFGGTPSSNGQIVVSNNMAWNTTTPVTINVAGSSPLAVGTYKLMSCTGTLSGSPPINAVPTITGTPLASGTAATVTSTNGVNGSVVLTVFNAVNTQPTNLLLSVSGNLMTLSWPADHTGWQLQVQTNTLGTNWVTLAGSTNTNQFVIPISQANTSVFYRLFYP